MIGIHIATYVFNIITISNSTIELSGGFSYNANESQ
jgi:hypothetical protein